MIGGPSSEYFVVACILGPSPVAPVRPSLADLSLLKTLEGDLFISASKLKLMDIIGRGRKAFLTWMTFLASPSVPYSCVQGSLVMCTEPSYFWTAVIHLSWLQPRQYEVLDLSNWLILVHTFEIFCSAKQKLLTRRKLMTS